MSPSDLCLSSSSKHPGVSILLIDSPWIKFHPLLCFMRCQLILLAQKPSNQFAEKMQTLWGVQTNSNSVLNYSTGHCSTMRFGYQLFCFLLDFVTIFGYLLEFVPDDCNSYVIIYRAYQGFCCFYPKQLYCRTILLNYL